MGVRYLETRQIWKHMATQISVLVVSITHDGTAMCRIMNGPRLTRLKVRMPATKLRDYGNRGFRQCQTRKGQLPVLGRLATYGEYNPRAENLGAK